MDEYYIGQYRDHYAIFDSMGRVQTQYDTHAEAKADLDSYNKTGKPLPESTVMNEGLFGLGKKKEIPKVTVDEIKIIPTNFRKAYDNWWFYLPLKNNMDKDMLCDISNRIRKICNSEYGFDAYPTEFMVCSPKDIVREYKVDDYFDKEYLKNKNNIVICDYEFVGKSNIKSVASLKQRLGARYFNDVVNNAVYYQIKDDPKNKGIPIPELINNSKNYAVSYIDKDTLMAMYNYFASRTSTNESVSFYEHTLNEGVVGAAFIGLIGLSLLYDRIKSAKSKKEMNKAYNNPVGITEKELNLLIKEFNSLRADILSKQKSSNLYKTLYQYSKEWNSNQYLDVVKDLKSGKTVSLEYDFEARVWYAFVEFFNDTNSNFTKNLKDPNDWEESDELEYKYEQMASKDLKKHITSLGFEPDNKNYMYYSKKYPNIALVMTDGDDGVGVIIRPSPEIFKGVYFKLITESEAEKMKKLNEDHSEISNDPEMEKLLALAGCTVEDLDTIDDEDDIDLDDDDPIDVNTSREIDAVMDESAADDYHKNHEERMKILNKKIDELNNDRKKDNEVREKQDKNAAALRDLLGESTPDLDFIMESIFMDIDH